MTSMRRRPRPSLALLLLTGLALLPACGDRSGEDTSGEITALLPWVRVPIAAAPADSTDAAPVSTAAYLVLQNPTPNADALVGVATPAAEAAEIHSVTMDDGVMRMRQVDAVPIPAAGEAVLEPGGYHIMLIGLLDPLAEGSSIPLELRLESGRTFTILAPVREAPPRP